MKIVNLLFGLQFAEPPDRKGGIAANGAVAKIRRFPQPAA